MKYNMLGRTGLFVSEICLGTMTFGGRGEMWQKIGQLDQASATDLVRASVDAGVNFFDTRDAEVLEGLTENPFCLALGIDVSRRAQYSPDMRRASSGRTSHRRTGSRSPDEVGH